MTPEVQLYFQTVLLELPRNYLKNYLKMDVFPVIFPRPGDTYVTGIKRVGDIIVLCGYHRRHGYITIGFIYVGTPFGKGEFFGLTRPSGRHCTRVSTRFNGLTLLDDNIIRVVGSYRTKDGKHAFIYTGREDGTGEWKDLNPSNVGEDDSELIGICGSFVIGRYSYHESSSPRDLSPRKTVTFLYNIELKICWDLSLDKGLVLKGICVKDVNREYYLYGYMKRKHGEEKTPIACIFLWNNIRLTMTPVLEIEGCKITDMTTRNNHMIVVGNRDNHAFSGCIIEDLPTEDESSGYALIETEICVSTCSQMTCEGIAGVLIAGSYTTGKKIHGYIHVLDENDIKDTL